VYDFRPKIGIIWNLHKGGVLYGFILVTLGREGEKFVMIILLGWGLVLGGF
jgi:hypothetical protein